MPRNVQFDAPDQAPNQPGRFMRIAQQVGQVVLGAHAAGVAYADEHVPMPHYSQMPPVIGEFAAMVHEPLTRWVPALGAYVIGVCRYLQENERH